MIELHCEGWGTPSYVAGGHTITTVRVVETLSHEEVHVWNRGGKSGVLVVDKGDGERVARAILQANA